MKLGQKIKCEICGKEFVQHCHNSRFCSPECQRKHVKATQPWRRRHRLGFNPKKYPRAGYVTCLKCECEFASWDTTNNRICPNCEDINMALGEIPTWRGYSTTGGMFFHG